MPPEMHPPHPTGFEQMRKRRLQQLPPASQQATAPRPANPAPVGIHGVAGRRPTLPAPAARVRFQELGAEPQGLQVHQRLVAVVPPVADHLPQVGARWEARSLWRRAVGLGAVAVTVADILRRLGRVEGRMDGRLDRELS